MRHLFTRAKPVLTPLQKKFKDAGYTCSLKKGKQQTTLTISYNYIVSLTQQTRPIA